MELKTQSYCHIEGIRAQEVQNVFKFRTRMTKVAENYKGKEGGKLCPLCDKHVDNQENLFSCEVLKEKFKNEWEIENIYTNKVNIDVARNVTKFTKTRSKILEAKKNTDI